MTLVAIHSGYWCGDETELFSLQINGFFLHLQVTFLSAQRIELVWNQSEAFDISQYGIYRATHIDSGYKLIATVSHPDNTCIDEEIQADSRYFYAVTAIGRFGNESGFSNIVEVEISSLGLVTTNAFSDSSLDLDLHQNYPNPFNSLTTFSYYLPQHSRVGLTIYDMNGREVCTLVDKFQEAGHHYVTWNSKNLQGTEVSSGIYYCRMKTANELIVRKMTILK